MPHRVVQFEPTPNPNALKCVLEPALPPGAPRSYFAPEQAAGDPLGAALMAIPGVRTVLINGAWVTVNKRPEADWGAVRAAVARVLDAAP